MYTISVSTFSCTNLLVLLFRLLKFMLLPGTHLLKPTPQPSASLCKEIEFSTIISCSRLIVMASYHKHSSPAHIIQVLSAVLLFSPNVALASLPQVDFDCMARLALLVHSLVFVYLTI